MIRTKFHFIQKRVKFQLLGWIYFCGFVFVDLFLQAVGEYRNVTIQGLPKDKVFAPFVGNRKSVSIDYTFGPGRFSAETRRGLIFTPQGYAMGCYIMIHFRSRIGWVENLLK